MSGESIKNRRPIFDLTIAFSLVSMTLVRWKIFGGDLSYTFGQEDILLIFGMVKDLHNFLNLES